MTYFPKSLIIRARMTFRNGLSLDRSGLTESTDLIHFPGIYAEITNAIV